MPVQASGDVTEMLLAWNRGESGALDRLLPAVQKELHKVARGYMRRERPDHTLQATALVNEAYLRLGDQTRVTWKNRAHFIGVAAQLMRRILVDHARARHAAKRGGGQSRVALTDTIVMSQERPAELLALDAGLTRLASLDPQQGQVVELRVFAGLSVEETSRALGISPATVKRDWAVAKAWLSREIQRTVA